MLGSIRSTRIKYLKINKEFKEKSQVQQGYKYYKL